MGAQESGQEKGPKVIGFSKAFSDRSFTTLNHELEDLTIYFSAHVGNDRRFSAFAKTHTVFNLGIIAGVNEALWKAYLFGPAENVIDKPENKTQYITLLLRLKALYEKYKTEKRINVGDILADLDDIVIELIDFSREVMKQSNCKQH